VGYHSNSVQIDPYLTISVTCVNSKMNQAQVMMSSRKLFRGKILNLFKAMTPLITFEDIPKNHKPGLELDGKKRSELLSLSVKLPLVNCWGVSRYDG